MEAADGRVEDSRTAPLSQHCDVFAENPLPRKTIELTIELINRKNQLCQIQFVNYYQNTQLPLDLHWCYINVHLQYITIQFKDFNITINKAPICMYCTENMYLNMYKFNQPFNDERD